MAACTGPSPGAPWCSPSAPGTSCSAPRSMPRAPSAPALHCSTCTPTAARPGPSVSGPAKVTVGVGNDGQGEGAWQGKVLGTYSHGPALARNPDLADLLLHWATGIALEPVDDTWPSRLREERLAAVAR